MASSNRPAKMRTLETKMTTHMAIGQAIYRFPVLTFPSHYLMASQETQLMGNSGMGRFEGLGQIGNRQAGFFSSQQNQYLKARPAAQHAQSALAVDDFLISQ